MLNMRYILQSIPKTQRRSFTMQKLIKKNFCLKIAHTVREMLLEKLDGFNFDFTKEQTVYSYVAKFDFESNRMKS